MTLRMQVPSVRDSLRGSMLGPSRAGRQRRHTFSRDLGHLAALLGVGCAVLLSAQGCGFPEYDFSQSAGSGGLSGGSSGADGGAGASGSSGEPGGGGTPGAGSGGSGASGAGAAGGQSGRGGAGGAGGAAGSGCEYPAPVIFPAHCWDGSLDGGETGMDCGGPECISCSGTQGCKGNSDCASNVCTGAKTCSQILSMSYMSIVADAFTRTPKFTLAINYLDPLSTPLQSVRIRYYFNHNGVAEPVLALHSQATYNPGNSERDISAEVAYRIHRYPLGPADSKGIVTDSYLEITFSSQASLAPGSTLKLTTDIVAGSSDPGAQFQQSTHYSFINAGSPIANNAITVYRGDQLLWGAPPPMTLLPDCAFSAGVNLNGPAVVSDGQTLQASSDAHVTYAGATYQNALALIPAADSGTTTLLETGFLLGSASATWPVPNGKYWAYAWLASDLSVNSGQLLIQDNAADPFFGMQQSGAVAWARVGPYAIDVLGGSVKLSGTGVVNVAGVELYEVAP